MTSETMGVMHWLVDAATLTVAAVGLLWVWHRRVRSEPRAPGGSLRSRTITYHHTPTVRVGDERRVDRISKRLRLAVNQAVDVLDHSRGSIPQFRVTLRGIREK